MLFFCSCSTIVDDPSSSLMIDTKKHSYVADLSYGSVTGSMDGYGIDLYIDDDYYDFDDVHNDAYERYDIFHFRYEHYIDDVYFWYSSSGLMAMVGLDGDVYEIQGSVSVSGELGAAVQVLSAFEVEVETIDMSLIHTDCILAYTTNVRVLC